MQKVLDSDWSEYDSRKKNDPEIFTYQDWELEYLINKIKDLYPMHPERLIKRAVDISRKELQTPRTRKIFVLRVMSNLMFLLH